MISPPILKAALVVKIKLIRPKAPSDHSEFRTNSTLNVYLFKHCERNDLIVSQEKSFRHAHIHLTAYELTRGMAEAVSEGFSLEVLCWMLF